VSPPPPTAEIEPISSGPADASTRLAAGPRRRGAAALLATLLAAIGLVFGAGAAAVASAPVGAPETAVEEADDNEETVASDRAQTRHRRTRTRGHRHELLRKPWRNRPVAALSPLVAAIRCTPRRGPPLLAD
jgi:hypothetical protein